MKIHNIANLQETSSVLSLEQETGVERIGWSSDGQLFAVCTRNGSVNVYVSHMPALNSVCGPRIAVLSSLAEVSLYNYVSFKVSYLLLAQAHFPIGGTLYISYWI